MKDPLRVRLLKLIYESERNVFLRREFKGMASETQINRVLKQLLDEEKLVRISNGIYARTKRSPITNQMIACKALPELGRETLRLLGYEIGLSALSIAYNEGKTTQVPTGRVIAVHASRLPTRKISYRGVSIRYEKGR